MNNWNEHLNITEPIVLEMLSQIENTAPILAEIKISDHPKDHCLKSIRENI